MVSFKNAVWNPNTRAATLVFFGPGTYVRRPGDSNTHPHKWQLPGEAFDHFTGYDIIFEENLKEATMLQATTSRGNRETFRQEGGDFKLVFVEDELWRRDTPGEDSYFLRRIIDEKGNKTLEFDFQGPLSN